MGYFLLFLMLVVELLSLAGSFVFGTFVIGPRVGGGDMFHWLAQHFVHLSPWWRRLLLHADSRGWGVVWVAINLLLQLAAFVVSMRKLNKARQGLGKPNPGDEEWERVQGCYQRFFQGSIRHSPPIKFKTPRSFRYKVGADSYDVEFAGRRLVIGANLLTPNNRHLAPLLAHQLAYYNSGDLWFRLILDYCPEIWFIRFVIIGMPVAAPTLIRDYIWPWLYWRKRVFQADLFACELGQCDALIRTLEAQAELPAPTWANAHRTVYPGATEPTEAMARCPPSLTDECSALMPHPAPLGIQRAWVAFALIIDGTERQYRHNDIDGFII